MFEVRVYRQWFWCTILMIDCGLSVNVLLQSSSGWGCAFVRSASRIGSNVTYRPDTGNIDAHSRESVSKLYVLAEEFRLSCWVL